MSSLPVLLIRRAFTALAVLALLSWAGAYLGLFDAALQQDILDYAPLWFFLALLAASAAGADLNDWFRPDPDDPENRPLGPVGSFVLSVGGVVCGLFFIQQGVRDVANGMASSRWPAVPARLIEAEERSEGEGVKVV